MSLLKVLSSLVEVQSLIQADKSLKALALAKGITIENLKSLASNQLTESKELTEEAKKEADNHDLDREAYNKLVTLIGNRQFTSFDSTLFKNILTIYKSSIKPLDDLLADRSVNLLVQRYPRYKNQAGASLLHMNPGELYEEYKEDGTPYKVKESTTFVHALFEAKAPKGEIIDYFKRVNNYIGDNKDLASNYMSLSNTEGISIKECVRLKNLEVGYEGIYSELIRECFGLFPEESMQLVAAGIDTHTASIHRSVDESLVKLAIKYGEDQVISKNSREVTVIRGRAWEAKIARGLKKLRSEIKDTISTEESLHKYLNSELVAGKDLDEAKSKFRFQSQTALRFLDDLNKDSFGNFYKVRSKDPVSCGLSPREIVAIGYESLADRAAWENPEQERHHFMSFVESMYVAKRGYNIDQYGDDEYKTHGGEADRNKCRGGIVNQLAEGLKDHRDVEMKIIDASTTKGPLLIKLPLIIRGALISDERAKKDIKLWLHSGVVSQKVIDVIITKLKEDKEFYSEFSASEIERFGAQAIRLLRAEELHKLAKKALVDQPLGIEEISQHGFSFDSQDGYITTAESFYKKNGKEKLLSWLNNEIRSGFVTGDQDSIVTKKVTSLMNFLLSSPNKELRQIIKEALVDHFKPLPEIYKNKLLILSAERVKIQFLNILLEAKADINTVDARQGHGNGNLLHTAALTGNTEVIEFLLTRMPITAINAKDAEARTILHYAVRNGNLESLSLLLSKVTPVIVNDQDATGNTVLHLASRSGNLKMTGLLVSNMPTKAIGSRNKEGQTALYIASRAGNLEIVKLLLSKMSFRGIGAVDEYSKTALHVAANKEIAELLLSKMDPLTLGMKDKWGKTALHDAAKRKNREVTQILINSLYPKIINARNKDGQTALHILAKKGEKEEASCLINRMTDWSINFQDKYGQTALHVAAEMENPAIIRLLLCKMEPETIAARDQSGNTALDIIYKFGKNNRSLEMLELIKHSKMPNEALKEAIKDGSLEAATLAIKLGGDPNQPPGHGDTLLMVAAKKDNIELVKFLIENGADINGHNNLNEDCFDVVPKGSGTEALLKELEEKSSVIEKSFLGAISDLAKEKSVTENLYEVAAEDIVKKAFGEDAEGDKALAFKEELGKIARSLKDVVDGQKSQQKKSYARQALSYISGSGTSASKEAAQVSKSLIGKISKGTPQERGR